MDKQNFIAGEYKLHYQKKDYQYKSFSPSFINKPFEWTDKRIPLLMEESLALLGSLNECAMLVPDIDSFILMHVLKEATNSTRIEGTRTEIDEAVLQKKDIEPERRNDWIEVHNYINAMNHSLDALKKIPLSMRLLKEAYKILLSGVRGQKRLPGEIRKSQNWIGGENIQSAFFIPPHHEELPELLSDLEKFWHNQELLIPKIIKVALIHYQFETIHPFLDGNGRIGRLLITLQLVDYRILSKPILYISDYFERNKGQYYDGLTLARETNNIDQWIIFFLSAVIATASKGKDIFEKTIKLRLSYEDKIRTLGRRADLGQKLLLMLFTNPVVDATQVAEKLDIAYNTASSILKKLVEMKMLEAFKIKSAKQLFKLWQYFDLFRS